MKKLLWPMLCILLFAGCSVTRAATIKKDIPPAPEGQAAVFGRVVLVNTVNGFSMPEPNLAASVYLHDDETKKTYKISTIDTGDFGVYLPPGTYKAMQIKTQGFKFVTDLTLTVPRDTKAVYTGTIILDGEPSGVIPGTMDGTLMHVVKRLVLGTPDTMFAYQVKDDQKEFETKLKKAAPKAEVKFTKAIFEPAGGVAAGYYPDKRMAQNFETDLAISGQVAENIAGGVLITLPYYLNPLFFVGFVL